MNKRAVESLIKSGALDCVCKNRNQMLSGYEAILDDIDSAQKRNIAGQINLFDTAAGASKPIHILPNVEELEPSKLLAMEKETTGLYISGHPMARFQEMVSKNNCTLIADITSAEERGSGVADGTQVRVAAIVNSRRLKSTRGGEMMAFVRLEDTSGSMEMLVFPKVLAQCSQKLVEGSVVLVAAHVSVREEEEAKLICEGASLPGEEPPALGRGGARVQAQAPSTKPSKNAGVYLRVESSGAPVFARVKNLLSIFAPERSLEPCDTVYFYFMDTKTYNVASRTLCVFWNPVLERELKKLLGEENVVYRA